jgi:SAM-dependent methyltransferase
MQFDWRSILRRPRPLGVVDTRGPRILGWAYDASIVGPLTIEFVVDGVKVGSTLADRYRIDLLSECPDGRCAFEFTLPPRVTDGSLRKVEVRVAGTTQPLLGGRFSSQLQATDYYTGLVRWVLRSGTWWTSAIREGGAVLLDGWCIAPPGTNEGIIRVNGHRADVTTGRHSEWKTTLPPGMTVRTFTGNVPIKNEEHLHISFGLERSFRPLQDLRYPLFDVDLPDAEHRKRVDGHGIEAAFNIGGYSTAHKLDTIASRYAGRPLAGLGPVLDWGCGCGRVSRFVARSGADLYGVDIDRENVLWCSAHIRGIFSEISPEPPTAFHNDFFGAIYGISVFTHLDRQYEAAWLKELHRIAKPGAILLLSIHGGMATVASGMVEHVFSPDFDDGFVDLGRNKDIDSVTNAGTYYRNVFHQPGHIAKTWGQYFDILSIEEGIVDNVQDLVVAQKPFPGAV